MNLDIKFDTKQLDKTLRRVQKQIPFATVVALNEVAKEVKADQAHVIERELDNPTPFTKRGFRVKFANKQTLTAKVFIAPIQYGYLKYQIEGGTNTDKGLVPQKALRLNKYGNMPKGALRNRRSRGTSRRVGGRIYTNPKRGVRKLLAVMTTKRTYKARYNFHGTGIQKANKTFSKATSKALDKVLKTMR